VADKSKVSNEVFEIGVLFLGDFGSESAECNRLLDDLIVVWQCSLADNTLKAAGNLAALFVAIICQAMKDPIHGFKILLCKSTSHRLF